MDSYGAGLCCFVIHWGDLGVGAGELGRGRGGVPPLVFKSGGSTTPDFLIPWVLVNVEDEMPGY